MLSGNDGFTRKFYRALETYSLDKACYPSRHVITCPTSFFSQNSHQHSCCPSTFNLFFAPRGWGSSGAGPLPAISRSPAPPPSPVPTATTASFRHAGGRRRAAPRGPALRGGAERLAAERAAAAAVSPWRPSCLARRHVRAQQAGHRRHLQAAPLRAHQQGEGGGRTGRRRAGGRRRPGSAVAVTRRTARGRGGGRAGSPGAWRGSAIRQPVPAGRLGLAVAAEACSSSHRDPTHTSVYIYIYTHTRIYTYITYTHLCAALGAWW